MATWRRRFRHRLTGAAAIALLAFGFSFILMGRAFSQPYIPMTDGSSSAPSRFYANDPQLGSYRVGLANEGFASDGRLRWDYNNTRMNLVSGYNLAVGGTLTVTGATTLTGALGATTLSGDLTLGTNRILFTDNSGSIGASNTTSRPANIWFGTLASGPKFTTTGTGSLAGLTVASGEQIGIGSSAAAMQFTQASANATIQFGLGNASTFTSGSNSFFTQIVSYTPAAGSGNWAAQEIRPTINASGAQTGTAYGLGIAILPTQLRAMTLNLIDVGTTTSTLFSGYTSKFKVDESGRTHVSGSLHVETAFVYGAHVVTIANDANAGTANAEVLAGNRSLYLLDCNDPQGCTMTIGESLGVTVGQMLVAINISTSGYNATFADSGNNHLAGALTLTPDDVVTFIYGVNRGGDGNWYEVSRSAN